MKKITLIFICLLLANIKPAKATTYYVDAVLGSDFYTGLAPLPDTAQIGPFFTIGFAVSAAAAGDTIVVAAGSYVEQITITKSLVIWGAQKGNKPTGTSRGSESVIFPSLSDVTKLPSTNNVGVYIISGIVEIDGFTFDGDNINTTTGTSLNGADPDVSYGIVSWGALDSVWLQNNIMINYNESFIYNGAASGKAENNVIRDCYLSNCSRQAIYLENNFYVDILQNTIDKCQAGISVFNYTMASVKAYKINDNFITTTFMGIGLNQLVISGLWQVYQNKLQWDGTSTAYVGIVLNNMSPAGNVSFSNNTTRGGYCGYYLDNNRKSRINITGDSLLMCDYGILSDCKILSTASDTINLDRVFITQNNKDGIFCSSDSISLVLKCNDVSINSSNNGVHVAGKVNWLANNTAFNIIAGYLIFLDSTTTGQRSKIDVNATSCIFDGKTGAVMTGLEGTVIEDRIFHYLDRKGLAYINFKTNNVFITFFDGNDVIGAGISKLTDNGLVHIKQGTNTENVLVTKNLTFINSYGTVQTGMITMLGAAKRLKLIGNINLSGGLTLTNGIIESSVGNAVHLLQSATITGGSVNSFVDGILYRKANGTGNVNLNFAIGKVSDYRPAEMNVTFGAPSGITEFSMEMFLGPAPVFSLPTGIKNISQVRYWRSQLISPANISNVSYKLDYGSTVFNDRVTQPTNLRVCMNSGAAYQNLGGIGSAAPIGTITTTQTTSGFGDLALANVLGGGNLLGKNGPLAIFSWQRGCQGDTTLFTDISVDLNNTITNWQWDFGDPNKTDDSSILNNPFYVYQDTGFFNSRLIVTNGFGQKDTFWQMVRITDNPAPRITFVSPCFPNNILFEDSGSVNIGNVTSRVWKIDGQQFLGKNVAYSYPAAGTYTVELVSTSSFGCKDSVQQTFVYGNTPNVVINPSNTSYVCIGDTISLSSTNTHLRYIWNSNETGTSIKRAQTGAVILIAYSSIHCMASDTAFVQIVPLPIAFAGADTLIYAGTAALLHASGGVSYLWSPANRLNSDTLQNPIAKPKEHTYYSVEVTDQYGCVSTDSVWVWLNEPDFIKIPNMVTPNGDGHNDVWDLSSVPDIENSKVVILDRWGGLVLETEKYKHNWNGRFEDKDLPDGTYIYIIKLKTYNTEVKGNLLLMR